jgi:hypothetical protein
MNIQKLPPEIQHIILSYIGYPKVPTSKIIKDKIDIYYKDHNWEYTKMGRRYYVCNLLSFSEYYFDIIVNPYDYKSYIDSQLYR